MGRPELGLDRGLLETGHVSAALLLGGNGVHRDSKERLMKAVRSRCNVLVLAMGVSMMAACSGADTPGTGDEPAGPAGEGSGSSTESPGGSVSGEAMFALFGGQVGDVGSGAPEFGLAGTGTSKLAAKVRISQMLDTGALKLLTEVGIEADGSFAAHVPLNIDTLIVQVVDLAGNVIGSAIGGPTGKIAGAAIALSPITAETSIEVETLIALAACAKLDVAAAAHVTAFVDAELASAIATSAVAGVDLDVMVNALASATLSAQKAHASVMAQAGAGVASGASAELAARAQIAASLGFAAQVAASLDGIAGASAVVFAAVHVAAELEAKVAASAIVEVMKVSGAAQATIDAALAAGLMLVADVAAATNLEALKIARLDFVEKLIGTTSGAVGGLLGELVGTADASVRALLQPVFGAVANLSAGLQADLDAGLDALVAVDACVEIEVNAELDASITALVRSLTDFTVEVHALGSELTLDGAADVQARAALDALAIAELLFRANP
jgi:hypothetical protein